MLGTVRSIRFSHIPYTLLSLDTQLYVQLPVFLQLSTSVCNPSSINPGEGMKKGEKCSRTLDIQGLAGIHQSQRPQAVVLVKLWSTRPKILSICGVRGRSFSEFVEYEAKSLVNLRSKRPQFQSICGVRGRSFSQFAEYKAIVVVNLWSKSQSFY